MSMDNVYLFQLTIQCGAQEWRMCYCHREHRDRHYPRIYL